MSSNLFYKNLQGEGSSVDIRLCPCNEMNDRDSTRTTPFSKAHQKSSSWQGENPKMRPLRYKSREDSTTLSMNTDGMQKTTRNELRNSPKEIGKYYYKIL